eukprot:1781605-Pleurochrysis_carterae.AAC.2
MRACVRERVAGLLEREGGAPALLLEVLLARLLDRDVDAPAHGNHGALDRLAVVAEVDGAQGRRGDRAKRLLRPFGEVVDRAVVHERGEVAQARAEGLAHRRHAQHPAQKRVERGDTGKVSAAQTGWGHRFATAKIYEPT